MKHTYVTMSGQTIPFINIDYVGDVEFMAAKGRWGYYIYFKSHHKLLVGDVHDNTKVKNCHDKLTDALNDYLKLTNPTT